MKYFFTHILVAISLHGFTQSPTKCKIYQYEGIDSTKKKLVSVENYNAQGLVTKSYIKNWKENAMVEASDENEINYYKNGLLQYSCSLNEDKDSTKSVYYYNDKGMTTQIIHYLFTKKLKPDVEKGIGSAGGCVVRKRDYVKKRTWDTSSVVTFLYDSMDNKIQVQFVNQYSKDTTSFIFTYDEKKRILSETEYNNQIIHVSKMYVYSNNTYTYSCTYYDRVGKPWHLMDSNNSNGPQYIYTCTFNERGQVISTIIKTGSGNYLGTETNQYNSDGKISKAIIYDSKGLPEITHVYVYE